MVQVDFFEIFESSEQASESQFEFACHEIYTNVCLDYLVWLSKQFQMFLWSLVIDCLTVGNKAPLLITKLNNMGAFFILFYLSIDIEHRKFTSGNSSHTRSQFPAVKGHLPQ